MKPWRKRFIGYQYPISWNVFFLRWKQYTFLYKYYYFYYLSNLGPRNHVLFSQTFFSKDLLLKRKKKFWSIKISLLSRILYQPINIHTKNPFILQTMYWNTNSRVMAKLTANEAENHFLNKDVTETNHVSSIFLSPPPYFFFPLLLFFSRLVPRVHHESQGTLWGRTGRGARGRTWMEGKAGIAEACVSGAHLLPA